MEDLFSDVHRNQVPYRATRSFPTISPISTKHRFEPSWNRDSLESRYNSTPLSNLHKDNSPPPLVLQLCGMILSENTAFASMLLAKSYHNPPPSEFDYIPNQMSRSRPKILDPRNLPCLGRGRNSNVNIEEIGPSSSDSKSEWPICSRGPSQHSRLSINKTDLSSSPQIGVSFEGSQSEFSSEKLAESTIKSPTEWEYFPGDGTCKNDYQTTKPKDGLADAKSLDNTAINHTQNEMERDQFDLYKNSLTRRINEIAPDRQASNLPSTISDGQTSEPPTLSDKQLSHISYSLPNKQVSQLHSSLPNEQISQFPSSLPNEQISHFPSDPNKQELHPPHSILHKQASDIPATPPDKQTSHFSSKLSHKHVSQLWSENGKSHLFSFLNPSKVPSENKTNFPITTNCDDEKAKLTDRFGDADTDTSYFSPSSHDPRHLWYYIDPKGSVQGPFLSEQMDGWFNRQYFPSTLPVWRECDPEAFELANLLNITENCSEPFSVGAERLLISREFSPVENQLSPLYSKTPFEKQIPSIRENTFPALNSVDQIESYNQNVLIESKNSNENNLDCQYKNNEINDCPQEEEDNAFKMSALYSYPDDVAQELLLSKSIINNVETPDSHIKDSRSEVISPKSPINMWLQGPPKIVERNSKDVNYDSHQTAQVKISGTDRLNLSKLSSAFDNSDASNIKIKQSAQHNHQIPRPCHLNNNITSSQSTNDWTKVGTERKQKKKSTSSNTCTIETPPEDQVANFVIDDVYRKYQISSNKEVSSSIRVRLDELDSFSIGKRSQSINIPIRANEASVVKFSEILSEQSNEECNVKLSYKEGSCQQSNFSLEDKFDAAKLRNPGSAWYSGLKESHPSFLDIESEQKQNMQTSQSCINQTCLRESQTDHQLDRTPTWAGVTKRREEAMTSNTTMKTSGNRHTMQTSLIKRVVIPSLDDVFVPSQRVMNLASIELQQKTVDNISELEPSESKSDSKSTPRSKQDCILLSQACYEWAIKEISNLNRNIDPYTIIQLLQGFNSLFEITQLGSELLGTSEKTNVLCKRIWDDLNKGNKLNLKEKGSKADEWVKVAKKTAKNSNKKKSKTTKVL